MRSDFILISFFITLSGKCYIEKAYAMVHINSLHSMKGKLSIGKGVKHEIESCKTYNIMWDFLHISWSLAGTRVNSMRAGLYTLTCICDTMWRDEKPQEKPQEKRKGRQPCVNTSICIHIQTVPTARTAREC